MLVSVLWLGILTAATYAIIRHWGREVFDNDLEAVFAAVPFGFALWAAFASAFLLFASTFQAGWGAFLLILFFGSYAGYMLWEKGELKPQGRNIFGFLEYLLIFAGAATVSFLVINSFSIQPDGSWSLAQGGSYGDASAHLSQVLRIGETVRWDFENPAFSGEFVRDPYFINLISGFLIKIGAPLSDAMHFPLIFLALSVFGLFILLFRECGVSRAKLWVAAFLVFLGGGLAYIGYFGGASNPDFPLRYGAVFPVQNIAYPGILYGFLYEERAFFLGFSLFLAAFLFLIKGIRGDRNGSLLFSGLLTGLMPFAHTHGFLAMAVAALGVLAYLIIERNSQAFDFVRSFVFPSFFVSIPQVAALALLPKFASSAFFSFRLGWMAEPGSIGALLTPSSGASKTIPWIRYFFTNFGLLPALLLVSGAAAAVKRERIIAMISLMALLLWLAPNALKLQGWDYEMNQFFGFAILVTVLGVFAAFGNSGSFKFRAAVFISIFLVLLASVPSSLMALGQIYVPKQSDRLILLSPAEREMAGWIRENTPENASIVSSAMIIRRGIPQEFSKNPVVTASGRKASMGNILFLYVHGIDYADREFALNSFLSDPKARLDAIKDVPADYVLIDGVMLSKYAGLEKNLAAAGHPIIFSAGELSLVKLGARD